MLFTAAMVVFLPTSRFKTTKDPLGTGTRIALDVNFPAKLGNAFATALPAPVSVLNDLLQHPKYLQQLLK